MRNGQPTPIQRALRERQQRLSSQAYPGDLAADVLRDQQQPSRLHAMRYPALALALLGIGLAIGIGLLSQPNAETTPTPMLSETSEPPEDLPSAHAPAPSPEAEPALAQTVSPVTPALPEIDRGLLPLQRNSQATWLASAKPHRQQLDKQARLAAHPEPSKRVRLTLSAPTRRNIGRVTARPLSLQPAPKPERNS